MTFRKICELPYGNFDGFNRVYKVYYVSFEFNLFLQGYSVLNVNTNNKKYYVLRKLNEIYDYAAINLDSNIVKELIEGSNTVDVSNDSVEGFAKRMEVEVFMGDSNIDSNDSFYEETVAQINQLAPAIVDYLNINIFIEEEKNKKININESKEQIVNRLLSSLIYNKSFQRTFPSDKAIEISKKVFPFKKPITIKSLYLFLKVMDLFENKDNNLKIDLYSMDDILFAMRIVDELPDNVVVQNLKGLLLNANKTFSVDFTQSSESIRNSLVDGVSNFYKINKVSITINKKPFLINEKVLMYRDKIMDDLFNKNKFSVFFKGGFFNINYITKTLTYSSGEKEYATKIEYDKDFNRISTENAEIRIQLIKE